MKAGRVQTFPGRLPLPHAAAAAAGGCPLPLLSFICLETCRQRHTEQHVPSPRAACNGLQASAATAGRKPPLSAAANRLGPPPTTCPQPWSPLKACKPIPSPSARGSRAPLQASWCSCLHSAAAARPRRHSRRRRSPLPAGRPSAATSHRSSWQVGTVGSNGGNNCHCLGGFWPASPAGALAAARQQGQRRHSVPASCASAIVLQVCSGRFLCVLAIRLLSLEARLPTRASLQSAFPLPWGHLGRPAAA